ncbi:MAG: lamin tail domain-containing protein [archaeon]|nr:MAG: lamin tail domain-containing protein [archaeon]
MNLSDIAIVASIIAGLASVPFVASTISGDYGPIGNIVMNMSADNIPGELSRLLTNEKFEQTYQTPFGRFTITVTSEGIYQELVRPDRKVLVEETPDYTKWELVAQNYNLVVNKTGTKITETFTSPDGYQEVAREMGNVEEVVRGNVENYGEAKNLLQEELQRMEKIKQDYMSIPGTENATSGEKIAINELLPDPNGTQDYNGDGNFTDAGDEFIELYNYGDSEVDLSGWELRDGNVLTIADGTLLNPGDFVYFVSGDKNGDYGEEWSGSWPSLTNSGDEIKLYNSEEELVNELSYGSSTPGKSWSRIPDGTGGTEERDPTPGVSN